MRGCATAADELNFPGRHATTNGAFAAAEIDKILGRTSDETGFVAAHQIRTGSITLRNISM